MKEEKEVPRDLLTQQLLTKATPITDLNADFTAQVMVHIEAKTQAQRAKIYEPLLSARVWRWIGIILTSMILLTLSLSVLAFGPQSDFTFLSSFLKNLNVGFAYKQGHHLPELFLTGLICFCWLVLDYLYGRLRKS